METRHDRWTAAIRLAAVLSVVAALAAVGISAAVDVPEAAIVLTVIVVAFAASWLRTDRVRRHDGPATTSGDRPQLV